MPYSSTSDLPQAVRDKYSEKCQRAFIHAFNSVHDSTGDESRAFAAGHAAAQRCEASKSAAKGMQMTLYEQTAPAVKFEFLTPGMLKASKGADGKMRLHGIASSTTRDLHGDVMTESALQDMENSANRNLTIFLNHDYTVPEDVGGSVERAIRRTRDVDHAGNPNIDLELDIVMDDTNPRAVQTWNSIQNGTKLGLSIGANLPEGGYKRNKDGTYVIEHCDLMETSIVGLPANPRSWVEYAVKALNDSHRVRQLIKAGDVYTVGESGPETLVVQPNGDEAILLGATCPQCGGAKNDPQDGCTSSYHDKAKESHPELPDSAFACIDSTGRHYPHHTSSGALNLKLLRNALARIADPGNTQCGKGHLEAHAKDAGIGDRKSLAEFLAMSDEEFETWAIDPPIAVGDGSISPSLDEVPVLPDVAAATVHIDIDTGSSGESGASAPTSQEAPAGSAPGAEAAVLDEAAEGEDELLGDTKTEALVPGSDFVVKQSDMTELIKSYARTAQELITLRQKYAELELRNAGLATEKDQAIAERDRVLTQTTALLSRLAEIPLVRRTAVTAAYSDFRQRFGGIYDEGFLQMLEKQSHE